MSDIAQGSAEWHNLRLGKVTASKVADVTRPALRADTGDDTMSDRNLNPHAEARVAMALWSDRYSKQKLGCMDFYDGLTAAQKSTCAQIVDGIIYADRADGRTRPPSPISVGAWRVFEDTDPQYCGIELEQAGNDDEPIMYPIRVRRDTFGRIVEAHNAEIARLESLHRSEIADMAERFRSVNVSEAMKQLADILPAAPAEHAAGTPDAGKALRGVCEEPLGQHRNERPTPQQSEDQYVPPGNNVVGLSIAALQRAHIERQEEWCPDQKPDLSFRGNELGGECGEAQNVIKKLERERHGWRGSRDTVEHLAEELGDVIHCAVLCAITAGIDLEPAVIAKFNSTSEKNGLATRLRAAISASEVEG